MAEWWTRYLQRHQHVASRILHAIGIPTTLAALVLAGVQLAQWRWDLWWRPATLLGLGYLLQYVGHLIEGNDMGEVVLLKKWLGKPYVAVSPRFQGRPGFTPQSTPRS
ncbi:MAG: DUF962 domain-containing protein [Phycisphaerae bacterium]|nr:DUF962 domain-containing protein [Phycisphaerae bacterium]